MNLSLEDLSILYSQQLIIPFSEEDKQKAWAKAKQENYDNPAAIWNDFLNCLCLEFIPSLQTDIADDFTVNLWLPENELSHIWQGINGTAIDITTKDQTTTRLVLIPTHEQDITELRVGREWLDLPNLVGNDYLAVQINEDENYLQIWGYTTYEQLKGESHYDAIDESYALNVENLIEDLTSMYATLELYPCQRPQLDSQYSFNSANLPEIISQLKSATMALPRLEIPFAQWGAIMDNPDWRKSLRQSTIVDNLAPKKTEKSQQNQAVNLFDWLDKSLTIGWQTLENLIDGNNLNLAYNYRRGNSIANPNFVEAFKLIDVPVNNNQNIQSLALVILLDKTNSDKFTLKFKLHTTQEKSLLPSKIKLQMLSYSEKIIQEVEARKNDSLIQLKQFTTTIGKQFKIQIVFDNFSWTQTFSIN